MVVQIYPRFCVSRLALASLGLKKHVLDLDRLGDLTGLVMLLGKLNVSPIA